MSEFAKFDGFDDLLANFKALPEQVAKKHLRASVSAGAKVVREAVKERAPVDTGRLKRSVYQKQIRERSGPTTQAFFVGVRSGAKRGKNGKKDYSQAAFYWIFREFGTSKLPAIPFLRPAFEAQKEAAVDAIAETLDKRIQKTAAELAGRKK